jgi:hypothetical protein
MTFAELKAEIATFCHRGDQATRIPQFVKRAESMIANRARTLDNVNPDGLLADGQRVLGGVYTLPADFLGFPKRGGLKASSNPAPLELAALGMVRTIPTAAPVAFAAVFGRRIEFRGAPSTGETVAMVYFYRLAALSGDADTNGILTSSPELYLHAALHWLHLDSQDLDMASMHKGLFEEETDRLNLVAERAMRAGAITLNAPQFTRSAF